MTQEDIIKELERLKKENEKLKRALSEVIMHINNMPLILKTDKILHHII